MSDTQKRIDRLKMMMEDCLEFDDDNNLYDNHPLPWTWIATNWDGPGIQFIDANNKVILPELIRDPELAATLLEQ